MTSQKQLLFAYGLAIHLLVVGIVCYAAFSTNYNKGNEKPLRLMYKTTAGKVLFDHNTHCDISGYGAACSDCHHNQSDTTNFVASCDGCHQKQVQIKDDGSEIISRVDAFHTQCIDCHKQIETGPQECSQCHIL